jgi:hypothetical protein
MTTTKDEETLKWENIVDALIEETQAGKIPWSPFRNGSRVPSPVANVRGLVYEGTYLGRRILVFEYEYERWVDEDRSFTETDVAIELIAKNSESTWRLPETRKRTLLLDAARKVTVAADEFADEVDANRIPF